VKSVISPNSQILNRPVLQKNRGYKSNRFNMTNKYKKFGVKNMFSQHTVLTIMILIMPFSGSPFLGSNILGIPGLKPINIFAILLLFLWLKKGGDFWNYKSTLKFRITKIYFIYLIIFSIEFFRSFYNIETLAFRYSTDFYKFYGAPFGYLLSYFIKPILITTPFIYIINHIKTKESIDATVDLLIISFFLFSIITLIISIEVVLSGVHRNELRDSFHAILGFHYNTVGTILMLSIPLALNHALTKGKLWWLVFLVVFLALLFCQSRGAILGGVLGAFIYLYLIKKANIKTLSFIILIGLIMSIFSDSILAIFSRGMESGDLSEISSGRIEAMWVPLIYEIFNNLDSFLFGYGLFGVIMTDSYIYNPYFYQATHAHNAYLDLLVDGGIAVFIPFIYLLYYSIKKSLQWGRYLKNMTYLSLLSSVFVYLISSISERQFFPSLDNMMLFPIISILLAMVLTQKKSILNKD